MIECSSKATEKAKDLGAERGKNGEWVFPTSKKTKEFNGFVKKNSGVRGDGPLVDVVDLDFVFPETLHIQLSILSSHLKFLKSYVDSVDTDTNKIAEEFKKVIESIGLSDRVLRKLYKNKRPPLIGYSCLKFREGLVNKVPSKTHWEQLESVADRLLDGEGLREIKPFVDQAPLSKFLLEHFPDDHIMLHFLKSAYSFCGIYEEITSLHTSTEKIARLGRICEMFHESGSETVYSTPKITTVYFHIVAKTIPRFVKRYYDISGNGYGANSMQGAEHLNKTTKTILKTRTNGRTDMNNYCSIAFNMEIRDQRFEHLKIKGKTKVEIQSYIKMEKLK